MPSHWTIADVDWNGIDRDRARSDELLYSLVATASFVESGADLYSSKAFMAEVRAVMRTHFPYRMAMKMLLRPLDLGPVLVKLSLPLLERAARRLLFAA